MSNSISDLFLSDMTLLVPSQDATKIDQNNQEIVPYSWDQRDHESHRNKKNGTSFIDNIISYDLGSLSFRSRSVSKLIVLPFWLYIVITISYPLTKFITYTISKD